MNKILILDDDEVIRLLYKEELSEEGYDVICSGDASRCIEMIREHRPNVVVMDEKVGRHDGVDVLRKIRGQFPALPLVLCMDYPYHGLNKNSGIVDFRVTKSSDMKDLKDKISAALGLRR